MTKHFDTIESEASNREFRGVTGTYKGKRILVQSTGIGCDNIDIVLNELDALANIDFVTREEKAERKQLRLVRVGTCGGLQLNTPEGTFVASAKSIGFDGLLNFYADRDKACDLDLEQRFKEHVGWNPVMGNPYVAIADEALTDQIAGSDMVRGITIACGGFYGPQGRQLRLKLMDPKLNEKIETFEYKGMRINNFEMESSALAGLARLMGHQATTCCMVIANRRVRAVNTNYKNNIEELIKTVLDRI